jgi:hypothetical protein
VIGGSSVGMGLEGGGWVWWVWMGVVGVDEVVRCLLLWMV